MIAAVRRFLDDAGFVEVETPVLQPIYGGAAARPFVTHHNQLDRDLYLRIATELYLKRCIVGGLERVYEIGKNFRNEGVSFKHNPEFTMLEWYEAYADYDDVARRCEALVAYVAEQAGYEGELDFSRAVARARRSRGAIAARTGVDILADRELAHAAGGDARAGPRGARERGDLGAARRPPALEVRRAGADPADVPHGLPGRDLAAGQAPPQPSRGLTERWEAFAGGMEIANAFTELNDPDDQRARFEEQQRFAAAGDEEAQPVRRGLPPGARARHAADGRDRHRHRPPGDAADRAAHDPRGRAVPGDALSHPVGVMSGAGVVAPPMRRGRAGRTMAPMLPSRPRHLLPLLVLAGSAVAAGPASAATYHVCAVATQSCPNTSLQAALDAAEASPAPDVVDVGAGTFARSGGFGYAADDATNTVELAGQGPATVLRGIAEGKNGVLASLAMQGPGSSVRDLAVAIPLPGDQSAAMGMLAEHAWIDRVAVAPDDGAYGLGLITYASTLREVDVESATSAAIFNADTVEDSTFSAPTGLEIAGAQPTTIARSRIEAAKLGISTMQAQVDVHDTVIRLAVSGVALSADDNGGGAPVGIAGRHLTLVGPGAGTGAKAQGSGAGGAIVSLTNSVMTGFTTPGVRKKLSPAAGPTGVSLSHSVLPPGASPADVTEHEVMRVSAPAFEDAAAGDYTLAAGSPALDLGVADVPGGMPATDLFGRARPVDADGDGVAAPDPGAFERPATGGGEPVPGGGEPVPGGGEPVPGGGEPVPGGSDPVPGGSDPAPGGADPAPGGGESGPAPGPGADTTPPAVGELRVRRGACPRARFTLSEAADVTVKVARRRGGRFRTRKTIVRSRAVGAAKVRLGRRALRRGGRYA